METQNKSTNRRPKLSDEIRLEIGRVLHEKSMGMQDVLTKYNIGESVAYKALQIYRSINGLKPSKRIKPRAAALYVSQPTVTDINLRAENMELQQQLQSAHEEIMVLQKILMVVGRTL